jgi:hypothetical protein
MHLTNYAINKKNSRFDKSETGSKRYVDGAYNLKT